jgi:hypothetical protein
VDIKPQSLPSNTANGQIVKWRYDIAPSIGTEVIAAQIFKRDSRYLGKLMIIIPGNAWIAQ